VNNLEDELKSKKWAKTDDKSCTLSIETSDDMIDDINNIILFMYFFLLVEEKLVYRSYVKLKRNSI